MIPWLHLDTATVPGGSALKLMQRGDEFVITASGLTLMSSRMSSSETALAALTCDRLRGRQNCRVLIGGYGMGFTLRSALAGLDGDARIIVAELVPAILKWARGPMARLTANCLEDSRIEIHDGDVGEVIASARTNLDAILLDVDNGPDGFSRSANHRLYDGQGLEAARRALRPGGLLAVWSAAPNKAFTERLKRAGFAVEEAQARANKGRGERHVIWIAENSAWRPTRYDKAAKKGNR